MRSSEEDKKPAALHIRIDRELHDEVVEYAKRTERSVNKAVSYLLRQGLAAEQRRES